MKKVLVIGSAVCDIVMPVVHLPARSEDINIYEQDMSLGGCAFNVCDCLRHFGVPFIPFMPVGSGIYGQFVRDRLEERGIRSACPAPEAASGCCYCLVEPDGERTFLCYHGAEYLFEESWFEELERSAESGRIGSVYVCGLEIEEKTGETIIRFLERHPGFRVFFAPSARICHIPAGRMDRMLALHPVLHLNEKEALSYTKASCLQEAGEILTEKTHNTVIVTCGADGCLVFSCGEKEPLKVDAFVPERKGDTIGAGDSHIGSVIALLAKGACMEDAVRGANRIASAVVGTRGAVLTDSEFSAAAAEILTDSALGAAAADLL